MTFRARCVYTTFALLLTFFPHTWSLHAVEPKSNPTWAAAYIKSVNKTLTDYEADLFAHYALKYAQRFNLDASVYLALIRVESGFSPEVKSSAGALGLTQVIPKWHQEKIDISRRKLGVYSMFEPRLNLYVGAWTLREMLDRSTSLRTGLLRYNGSLGISESYANKVLREAARVESFRI